MKTVFVSYASEEAGWKERIVGELEHLQKSGQLRVWQDSRIGAGAQWEEEIFRHLKEADAFLVLASKWYISKPFIRDNEFPAIRDRVEHGKAHLFWLPLDEHASTESASDEILEFLGNYQTAHAKRISLEELNDRAARGAPELQDALTFVVSRFKEWLKNAGTSPAGEERAPGTALFDLEQIRRFERSYLRDVVRNLQNLPVSSLGQAPGGGKLRQLPLERIYITLRADPTTLADRLETRALHQELAGMTHLSLDAEEDGRALPRDFSKHPRNVVQQILAERGDRIPLAESTRQEEELILERAFRQERLLVILGDPGSGKSVLCRWLALQLARKLQPGESSSAANPADPADLVELGPARLPILLRVADLNPWLQVHIEKNGRAVIPDFLEALEAHARLLESQKLSEIESIQLTAVLQAAIEDHRAVVLVDGLDEVPDASDRELITEMIEAFAVQKVIRSDKSSFVERLARQGSPGETGGNQVVITSRITGYHLAPLRLESEIAAHYLIRPLDDARVARFCSHIAKVFDDFNPDAGLGRQLLEHLESSLLPGLDRLKRNPLLLTSLISYWYPRRHLPESRAELYHAILLDLCARWRSMKRIMIGFSDELRAWLEDDEKVLDLLGAIAWEIHLHYPSGRIGRGILEQVVRTRLMPKITGKRLLELDDDELRKFEADVVGLISLICTQVGALTEVGSNVFSFLHLTFQEYLVGRALVRNLPGEDPESAFVAAFLERLGEPRWKEPLLFAFGEIGQQGAAIPSVFSRQPFLESLRKRGLSEGAASAADLPLFIADLIAELPPGEIGEGEVRATLQALAEGYAACGHAVTARRQRERIAERIADLRRSPIGGSEGGIVDRLVCGLMADDPLLAPALAHLYWERLWLTPDILDMMAACLHLDGPEWGWPMESSLRWCLLAPEDRLTIDPIRDLKPPAQEEDSEDIARARRRYELSFETWEGMQRSRAERVMDPRFPEARFPLRHFFLTNPSHWARLLADSLCSRALVALLSPLADLRAAFWQDEYLRLSYFLQQTDAIREAQIDREPEAFVPRWGLEDIVYNCAVYLDTNQGGRFKLARTRPVALDAAQIAHQPPPEITGLIQRCADSENPAENLREGLIHALDSSDPEIRATAALALAAMGLRIDGSFFDTALGRRALQRAERSLADAVLRGLTQQAPHWLKRTDLGEAELAVVYRQLMAGAVAASGLPSLFEAPAEQERLKGIALAEKWAQAFVGRSDDAVYNFAVCLDTGAPAPEGWTSPLPLLSQICCSANAEFLKQLNLLPQSPPLWGISPNEIHVPPQAFDVLLHLTWIAVGMHSEFGAAFAELFLRHLPRQGVRGSFLDWTGSFFDLLPLDDSSTASSPNLLRAGGSNMMQWLTGETTFSLASLSDAQLDPFECAFVIEAWFQGTSVPVENGHLIERAAGLLGQRSQIDESLFLARMALRTGDNGLARRWIEAALGMLDEVEDQGARAEALARLAPHLKQDPSLWKSHGASTARLTSPLLRAHASGTLGSFFASKEFAWNDPAVLGTDTAWIVASVFFALRAADRTPSVEKDLDDTWRALAASAEPRLIDHLLRSSGDRGLACTQAAIEAMESMPDVDVERLLPLLSRPSTAVWSQLQRWASGLGNAEGGRALPSAFSRQAAILLAESRQELDEKWLDLLFEAMAEGDDRQAVRAELALAGPWRDVGRAERRFKTSRHGIELLKTLAQRLDAYRTQTGANHLAHVAICSINDWIVDAPEPLESWCQGASPGSPLETSLLDILHACDLWSPECQQVAAGWLSSACEPSTRSIRASALLAWASRLSYLKNTEAEPLLLELLSTDGVLSHIDDPVAFPLNQENWPRYELVADACAEAAARVVGTTITDVAEAQLQPNLIPIYQSAEATPEGLVAFGSSFYQMTGDRPEACWHHVAAHLDRAAFRRALVDWLSVSLQEWQIKGSDRWSNGRDKAAMQILKIKLHALLSFTVCLSHRSESAFARLCEPERFLEPLAWICVKPPNDVAQMAAITLISRLKQVDLDLPLSGSQLTVLDALLSGLRGGTSVRERLIETVPRIYQLRGVHVLDRLGAILTGEGSNSSSGPRIHAGSEVLAAAQLLSQLIQRGSLREAGPRRRALDLLRQAASSPLNNRPLFKRVGYGNDRDPVRLVHAGHLSNELQNLLARL